MTQHLILEQRVLIKQSIINKVIKKYYELYGYGEFAGFVDKQIKSLLPNVKGKAIKRLEPIKAFIHKKILF